MSWSQFYKYVKYLLLFIVFVYFTDIDIILLKSMGKHSIVYKNSPWERDKIQYHYFFAIISGYLKTRFFLIPLFECKKNFFIMSHRIILLFLLTKTISIFSLRPPKICYILGISIVYCMTLQKTEYPSGAHEFIPVFVEFVLLNFYFSV